MDFCPGLDSSAPAHVDGGPGRLADESERDLRHLAVGRNNWLLFGSQRGGEMACRLSSLLLSCKQCGAPPQAYLEDVLMKVATVPESRTLHS